MLGDEQQGITAAQAILMKLRQKATQGDIRAAEVLLDRAYGKPKQQAEIDLTTAGQPLPDHANNLSFEELYKLKYGKSPDADS